MHRWIPTVTVAIAVAACSGEPRTAEGSPRSPSRSDSVQIAMAAFDPAAFDTITWESDSAATERGSLVFQISCSKCHGATGRGDAGFVIQGDTLRPPSFLPPDWRFANDPLGLRRQIYTGNVAGMPYWGLVGLKYRDVDAVARYIMERLRRS